MSAPSDLVLMARVAGSLVVVVLVALLAARLARRVGVRSAGPGLRVVERVGLTREAGAVVLEVDGRHLLLGVTAHGVSLLADLGGANPVLVAEPHALVAETDTPAAESDAPAAETHVPVAGTDEPVAPVARLEPAPPGTITRLPEQPGHGGLAQPAPRTADGITVLTPLSRRAIREATGHRRLAVPPTQRGTGSVLDPRTWRQGVEALRDLTARRR
jgi:flagellar biogenesis protein FliO